MTTRTAGFNTIDLTKLSDSGIMLMIVLMLIGGAPGSTAGGMKTTTFFVLLVSTFAVFGSKRSASVFHRRISAETIRKAAALFMTYITLFLLAAMIISRIEGLPLLTCMFETASAIGTVGLTLGITPQLGAVSHLILIFLMFFGRVGCLTLIFAAIRKSILLIGLGRFGRHTAMKLQSLGHEVMAVDKQEGRVSAILPFVTNALIGDSTRQDFLESLGVRDYDLCIVAIGDDFQSSLETTSLLKELGAKKVVSRASRDVHAKFLLRNGADEVVYPEKQVAEWTALRYSSDHLFDYFSMGDGYAVMEIEVPLAWIGKTIGELDIRNRFRINIMAAKTDGKLDMQITNNTEFTGREKLLVLGKDADIQKCFHD